MKPLPGMPVSSQFMGWAIASADGQTTADTARELMTALCEYTLRLDNCQSALLPDPDLRQAADVEIPAIRRTRKRGPPDATSRAPGRSAGGRNGRAGTPCEPGNRHPDEVGK